jgi:hypothetical protein
MEETRKSTSAQAKGRKNAPHQRPRGYAILSGAEAEAPKKKNLRLRQSKIDAAKAVLGTATETETIEAALDLIVFRNELVEGTRAMRGANLIDVFDGE